ncbi:glucosaminidase domain-containing protein [Desulfovibrio cuneatus]|uniref:glucosaminidase domain-containing protein n=1 Tax=Desulfovibrio cuneatus TaxID=159728 RepID=UPI000488E938|nr:glucosaminidase domain-containing protein [Desulfovibrio cuneatus]
MNIDPDYLMALASHESSWLNDHNFGLNNLFGVTNAGKRNLSYSSLGKSVEYWVKNFGERVRDSKNMEAFIHGLRHNGPNAYNSEDAKYDEKLRNQYKTIIKRKPK